MKEVGVGLVILGLVSIGWGGTSHGSASEDDAQASPANDPWVILESLEALDRDGLAVEMKRLSSLGYSFWAGFTNAVQRMPDDERRRFEERLAAVVGQLFTESSPRTGSDVEPPATLEEGTEASLMDARPVVRLGIDRPRWYWDTFNLWNAGTFDDRSCVPGTNLCLRICIPETNICYDSSATTHDWRAISTYPSAANVYSAASSVAPAPLSSAGSILAAIQADIAERRPTERQAWAAMGMEYDLVAACAEQGATVEGIAGVDYLLRGRVESTSGFNAFGYADVQLNIMPYTSSATPLAEDRFAPVAYADAVTTDWVQSRFLDVHKGTTYESIVNQRAGRGSTYGILSAETFAFAGILGIAHSSSDFYEGTDSLWIQYVHLRWRDNSAPVATHQLLGTAGVGNWFRTNVNVFVTASDADTCVNAIGHRIGGGPWEQNDVSPWLPEAGSLLTADGIYVVEYRARNHNDLWSTPNSISVKIDKTAPTGAITFPDERWVIVQDYGAVGGTVVGYHPPTFVAGTHLTIKAQAGDPVVNGVASGVREVRFYVDGDLIGTDATAPYEYRWSLFLESGPRDLSVCVQDKAGNAACEEGPRIWVVG